jgi:ATP-dependent DNA ligase
MARTCAACRSSEGANGWSITSLVTVACRRSQSVEREGEALFALACEQDQERSVAKRLDSRYTAGRMSTWLNIKNKAYSRQDAVTWHSRS